MHNKEDQIKQPKTNELCQNRDLKSSHDFNLIRLTATKADTLLLEENLIGHIPMGAAPRDLDRLVASLTPTIQLVRNPRKKVFRKM